MKKILVIALCLLMAVPTLSWAGRGGGGCCNGHVNLCGVALVFGLFGAISGDTALPCCWTECGGAPIGGALLTGEKCVDFCCCGKFCFDLALATGVTSIIRNSTKVCCDVTYLGGWLHLCGCCNDISFMLTPNMCVSLCGCTINLW